MAAIELPKTVKCPLCDGAGGGYAVWGQLDTHYDCLRCNGTGRLPVARAGASEEGGQ